MATFRKMLSDREKEGETAWYAALQNMQAEAQKSWLGQTGQVWGSYNGVPHLTNVERNLDHLADDELKSSFSSTEIFILLAAVLLHDIGKLMVKDPKKEAHYIHSCSKILKDWYHLKIPDFECARWIAVLACAHGWPEPLPPPACPALAGELCALCFSGRGGARSSELDADPVALDGPVRLRWLAALLRMADEVDNEIERAVPDWLRDSLPGEDPELSWRRNIHAVLFDRAGQCIKLSTLSLDAKQWGKKQLAFLGQAVGKIDIVLQAWCEPLEEMGIFLKRAFIDVALPAPSLYTAADLDRIGDDPAFVPSSIEPALENDPLLLDKLYVSMVRLDNGVIDKVWFSWEALAEEAGIVDVALARMGVRRINAISQGGRSYRGRSDPFPRKCIITSEAWRFDRANTSPIPVTSPPSRAAGMEVQQVIPTGIAYLDEFLSPDYSQKGFFAPTTNSGRPLFPIIAIEGGSGLGKSTLSMQIACNIMQDTFNGTAWCCLFYSLEQEPEWIIEHLKSHHYFNETRAQTIAQNVLDLEDSAHAYFALKSIANKLLLPKLTPRAEGYRNLPPESLFQRRYSELEKSISWLTNKGIVPFFFIDSLSAFAPTPLTRNQIHRLFTLFRSANIPLLVTLERLQHWAIKEEEIPFNVARYLADIVIKLDEAHRNDYYYQTIEVTKTRYNRRILGQHLLKLKSAEQSATKSFDPRLGIVIYPSIHNHLVHSRSTRNEKHLLELDIRDRLLPLGIGPKDAEKRREEGATDQGGEISPPLPEGVPAGMKGTPGQWIDSDTSIVITGPYGGHKFAVAMNLLLRTEHPVEGDRKLIVSFAEEREINLRKLALLHNFTEWRNELATTSQPKQPGAKVWEQQYGKYISLLNFRMGQIMPEEFLQLLDNFLERNRDIRSILFTDTVQMRTRFPSLESEPLFWPVVVDIVKNKGLYSIFIDVQTSEEATHALLSAADIRMYIEKEPKSLIHTIRLDNVRGKDYDRRPRTIDIARSKQDSGFYALIISQRRQARARKQEVMPPGPVA